jgi:hypothetical protein
MNTENEWLKYLEGERDPLKPVIRNARPAHREISRGQRRAILDEKDQPTSSHKNKKQRKAING